MTSRNVRTPNTHPRATAGNIAAMPRDTSTRFEGVYARHRQHCQIEHGEACSCTPAFWGKAYDRARGRSVKTAMLPSATAARSARADLLRSLAAGQRVLDATGDLKLVQKLLGHESIRTTGDVYVDYDIDQWALLLAKAHESEGEDA